MRLALPSLAVLLSLAFASVDCAYADASPPPPRSPDGTADRSPPSSMGFRVELVDDASQPLPTFDQGGRAYVLGQKGDRYQVRVVNPTGARIEAVVSVDGLDAIDGRPGSLSKRGYIIPAYGDVVIDGFRTSLDTVASFRFSSVRDSYAARTQHARNVGVIGVAFFRERPPPVVHYQPPPAVRRAAPAAAPADDVDGVAPSPAPASRSAGAANGAAAESRAGLGTQFGEARDSHVVETTFVRAESSPMTVCELRYDDRDGLLSRGIELAPPRDPRDAENDLRDTAEPFPQPRFAQPPR